MVKLITTIFWRSKFWNTNYFYVKPALTLPANTPTLILGLILNSIFVVNKELLFQSSIFLLSFPRLLQLHIYLTPEKKTQIYMTSFFTFCVISKPRKFNVKFTTWRSKYSPNLSLAIKMILLLYRLILIQTTFLVITYQRRVAS